MSPPRSSTCRSSEAMCSKRNNTHNSNCARPLLLEYTSESMERLRQEELYRPPSRTLQWCIAPLVFMATMIPASVLLLQILQAQNQGTGSIHHSVTLMPTLSVGVDVMGIGVVVVSVLGLMGVARGCNRLMNLYFALVLCFIAVQVGNAVLGFMSGSGWIQEALEKSWDTAYEKDKVLIRDLQTEFHCQGFHNQEDRAASMSADPEIYLPPCGGILQMRFGKRLQRLGWLILCIRLVQLTGVFLLSILFKHLAGTDLSEEEQEEREQDEESSYFKSEKQIEEESSRIPLLAGEEGEDLPYYSARDIYGSEGFNNDDSEEESEEDDGDDGDENNRDEEQQLRGRICHDHSGYRDYSYRDLPVYAEDEKETQVFVA